MPEYRNSGFGMAAANKPLVAPPEPARAFRLLLAGYVILFVLVAVVLVALQLPILTLFLALVVTELVVSVPYGLAMHFILRRVVQRATPGTRTE